MKEALKVIERPIYLDYNATTPLDPEVIAAMQPYLSERFGNPSSSYALARDARKAVDTARDTAAELLSCRSTEVLFTSGGSEGDNFAILLEYEFENQILSALGYNMSWR